MQEIAGQLDKMLRDAIEQSRSLSHELSPAVLYQSDLGETFEWLARQVQSKHGLTVHTEVHGRVDSQSESIKAFLFRAGQEILFNAVKHAKVKEARLRLQRRNGASLADDWRSRAGLRPQRTGASRRLRTAEHPRASRAARRAHEDPQRPGQGQRLPDRGAGRFDRGRHGTEDRRRRTEDRESHAAPSSVVRPSVLRSCGCCWWTITR